MSAVRRAPRVRACLLVAAACLGACSDNFVVGREAPCLTCNDKVQTCIGAAECLPVCAWSAGEWEAYESCRCDACATSCGGCPAAKLSVTTFECISCRSNAGQVGEACREAWLECSAK